MSWLKSFADCVVLLQIQGPDIKPFTLEKENLILGLWQLQQAGQDVRIKEVSYFRQSKLAFCPDCCFLSSSLVTKWISFSFSKFECVFRIECTLDHVNFNPYPGHDMTWYDMTSYCCTSAFLRALWW